MCFKASNLVFIYLLRGLLRWCLLALFLFCTACHRVPVWQRKPLLQSQLQLARMAILNKQWQMARSQLNRAANVSTSYRINPIYWSYLAQVDFAEKKFSGALRAAKHAWQLQPHSFLATNNYASLICMNIIRAPPLKANNAPNLAVMKSKLRFSRSLWSSLLRESDLSSDWRNKLLANRQRCHLR